LAFFLRARVTRQRTVAGFLLWLLGAACALADPVTVAAYNVENYLPGDRWIEGKRAKNAPKPEESINALVEIVASVSPDILGITEMGDRPMLEDFRRRLGEAGLDYPYDEWVEAEDTQRHICLLSKFPVTARHSIRDAAFELDGKRHRMQRGILDATIEVRPGFSLRLVGAHLKSRREVPAFDQARFRAKEASILRRHMDAILGEDPSTKLVLFGDLNDTKNEYPVRQLIGTRGTDTHLFDIWLRDSRGDRWTHYWSAADIYSRIDYIMVSRALVPFLVLEKSGICDLPRWNLASDHRLIHTVIDPDQS
jgi:endonuclease/exonuclease/phosphatase family metal-dependent hydrolase